MFENLMSEILMTEIFCKWVCCMRMWCKKSDVYIKRFDFISQLQYHSCGDQSHSQSLSSSHPNGTLGTRLCGDLFLPVLLRDKCLPSLQCHYDSSLSVLECDFLSVRLQMPWHLCQSSDLLVRSK